MNEGNFYSMEINPQYVLFLTIFNLAHRSNHLALFILVIDFPPIVLLCPFDVLSREKSNGNYSLLDLPSRQCRVRKTKHPSFHANLCQCVTDFTGLRESMSPNPLAPQQIAAKTSRNMFI